MPETKISDIIKSSLGNIRDAVDANTIIGDPITTQNGTVILPVSKVTVGVATGGLDYNPKKDPQAKTSNFGGGGGTGLSVSPVAFLVVKPDGQVELLNVNNPTDQAGDPVSAVMTLLGKAPDLLSKAKSVFASRKNKESDENDLNDLDEDLKEETAEE